MLTPLLIFLGYESPSIKKIKNYDHWKYVYYLYTLIIGLLLVSPIFLGIVKTISTWSSLDTPDPTTISLIIFTAIPFIQYCLGFRYFRQSHFTNVLTDCRREGVSLPRKFLIWTLIGIVVTSILTIKIVLWNSVQPPTMYNWFIERSSKTGILLYVGIYSTYAWTAVSLNITTFFLVFYKHIYDLKALYGYTTDSLIWKMDQTTINDLTRKIIGIRYIIRSSIDRLESFYTFATILGAIAIGPIIQFYVIDPHLIMFVIIYLIMQVMFLSMIYQITYYREEIHKVIKSPVIMSRYLTQVRSLSNIDSEEMQNLRLRAFNPIKYGDLHGMETGSKLHEQILTLEYKMSFGLDWIILHNYLQESWANFSLMGISFGDTSVIKKGIGLTSIIIIISTYINSLILV